MALRAAGRSFITFMPVHQTKIGHNLISMGFIVSLFILAATMSGPISGALSERIGFNG